MNYDFNKDDEVLDIADSVHEEKDKHVQLGKHIAREKKYHALVGSALKTTPLDDNCVTSEPNEYKSDAEAIIECDLPSAKDAEDDPVVKGELVAKRAKIIAEVTQALPIGVKSKQAKEQRQASFTDAMQEWGTKLKEDEGMRVASGFKPKGKVVKSTVEESSKAEPWYIKEGIERGYIKGDKSRLNETLYQFFNDFNGVVDAFGIRAANDESSPDHAIQIDNNGKTVFIGGMTYDRKQRAVAREDGQKENGSESRVRQITKQSRERVEIWYGKGYYDKDVAIPITDTGAVDCAGYNPARGDLLLAERITDTKHRAEEVAVFVGPLLPELRKAVLENATAKELVSRLVMPGRKHPLLATQCCSEP
jgi:hypothetical protein